MLSNLSALPPTIPTLDPDGSGLTHGPRHALERVHDAGGTIAALTCWKLWKKHGNNGKRLSIPFAELTLGDPLNRNATAVTHVRQSAPHEAKGGGYVLFSDLTVLIFQRSDQYSWNGCYSNPERIEILPIVFRIAPVISTRGGNVRVQTSQTKSGLNLSFTRSTRHDKFDPAPIIKEQIAREVGAWAAWIRYMPPLCNPDECHNFPCGDWPAFFPRGVARTPELKEFEHHVIDVVHSVMAWAPTSFHQAQVSVWSSRPLQGGVEPLKIILNWQLTGQGLPYQNEALQDHVYSLVFGPELPWRMDDFQALKIFREETGQTYSSSVEVFTHLVSSPISNHERLSYTSRFPAPPAPPPLPGMPGYGRLA